MKLLSSFMLFLATAFVISSCQKELSFEAGIAKGTLAKDALGDCMPITVTGSYKKDTLLKPTTNYVDVQVNITKIGSYFIKTDTLNGYSFSATGVAAVTGVNTVRLLATGRPVAPALNVFTVRYDTSICQFDIVVTGAGGGTTAAVFTLNGSPTTCTGATQNGNFYATIPTTSANTVTINANVTVAGSYTIQATTTPANGLTFTASGNLAVGTNQPIILQAVGTASTAGSIPYTLSTATPASNCGFNLTVQAAPTPATYTFECPSNPTFFGTYQAGVSTAGDSIRINVTSINGGSYTITTNTTTSSNGVTYGGSGVLAASPNPQSVTLYVSGTPGAAGPFTYTLTGTGVTSTCTFTQTYSAAPVSNGIITCNIDGVPTTFNFNAEATNDNSTGVAILSIDGKQTSATANPSISLGVVSALSGIAVFNYDANQVVLGNIISADYLDAAGLDYFGGTDLFNQTVVNPVKIYVTSLSITRVKGTFSGTLKVGTTANTKVITLGTFDVPIVP